MVISCHIIAPYVGRLSRNPECFAGLIRVNAFPRCMKPPDVDEGHALDPDDGDGGIVAPYISRLSPNPECFAGVIQVLPPSSGW